MCHIRSSPSKFKGASGLLIALVVIVGVAVGIGMQRMLSAPNLNIRKSPVQATVISISDHFGQPYVSRETAPALEGPHERAMYDRLTTWEARFDRTKLEVDSKNGHSELVTWPGSHIYLQSATGSGVGLYADGADVWQYDFHNESVAQGVHWHGTAIGANLDVLRSSIRPTLYDLGVLLVGDVRMSDAFLFSKNRVVSAGSNGTLSAAFTPPRHKVQQTCKG